MPSLVTWRRREGCSKLIEKVISQARFETGRIDHLFESYADLLERAQAKSPDLVEITAVAAVLHSFYNGLEGLVTPLAKVWGQVNDDLQLFLDSLSKSLRSK